MAILVAAGPFVLGANLASADGAGDPTPAKTEGGKYYDKEGNPTFGMNPNVMCYLDDLFVYLRARANGAVPRGRPQKHEEKPEAATQAENSCLGHKS